MAGEISAIESAIREKDMEILMDFRKVKDDCNWFLDEARTITDDGGRRMEGAILILKFRLEGHILAFQHDVSLNDGLKSAIDAIHDAKSAIR